MMKDDDRCRIVAGEVVQKQLRCITLEAIKADVGCRMQDGKMQNVKCKMAKWR
jgi:hypothetical protein